MTHRVTGAIIIALVSCCAVLHAQTFSINLAAVDARNGRVLPHQRLLVFSGESPDMVRAHSRSQDVTTDERGNALLELPSTVQWVQVFVDYQTLCQSDPNARSFSVGKVRSSGETTPNNCGAVQPSIKPNQLTIFARPATWREKMGW